jgi:hypothetical protein
MTTPNTKADIMSLPLSEQSEWMSRLTASIPVRAADGSLSEDTATIERFGFTRADFPDDLPAPPLIVPQEEGETQPSAVIESPSPIALGEAWVSAAGLTAARLVTLMDLLMTTKEANALAAKPKLVALYTWLQTVKAMAVAGQTNFPAAPHTFEEVVSE